MYAKFRVRQEGGLFINKPGVSFRLLKRRVIWKHATGQGRRLTSRRVGLINYNRRGGWVVAASFGHRGGET